MPQNQPDPIYYLKSIERQLESLRTYIIETDNLFRLGTLILDDNLNFLNNYIYELESASKNDH